MTPYPVDLDPEVVIAWLLNRKNVAGFNLRLRALRNYEKAELESRDLADLDDEDRQDLSGVIEVGRLEVTPARHPHFWILQLTATDDLGPRTPDDESVQDEEEEIDLDGFVRDFVEDGHGGLEMTAEVRDDLAAADLERLLRAVNLTSKER